MAKNKDQLITFVTDDGTSVVFEVLEQTTIAGCNYLLVMDFGVDESEEQAYIMKEVLDASDAEMVSYEFVEDEQELDSISKVFEELLEDTDLV